MSSDSNSDAVKLLSDDEVAEIQSVNKVYRVDWRYPNHRERVDSLCATVRALSEKYEWLKSKTTWHRDGVGPDVPVMQERYDRLMAQRTALTTGLANIYHVITNEECDRAVALGMATSAVSSLLNQNTALREELAHTTLDKNSLTESYQELEEEYSKRVTEVAGLKDQLAQVTQSRDELQERLDDVERSKISRFNFRNKVIALCEEKASGYRESAEGNLARELWIDRADVMDDFVKELEKL